MKKRLQAVRQTDISRRAFWVLVALVFCAKFALTRFQLVYTWVDGAPLDDELMFRAAQSISAGQWLGPYDYLTLSKGMFFAVWLAFVHLLHLPYLGAGQLLWCGACLAAAQALRPVMRRYRPRFVLFALLAFAPSAMAGYTLRVYRDNIFPALCLLFFAGIIGYALRCTGPLKRAWGWLACAGLGLTAAWLTREDGVWLLPFALAGGVCILVAVWKSAADKKLLRSLLLGLPFALLFGGISLVSGLNTKYYGVYTISDFSSGSFADAIGAMTRVESESWQPLVSVPTDVREKLYASVPELSCLAYWMEEDEQHQNNFRNPTLDDYQSGSFYWAIRRAAQFEGIYDSAPKAEAYWAAVAEKINALCDDGTLPSTGKKRSGTTPPIRAAYVLPVLQEGARGIWYAATFQDCAPYLNLRTIGTAEDLALWESYLGEKTNVAAVAGGDAPYYSPLRKIVYALLDALRWVYAVALPLALVGAVVVQLRRGLALLRKKRTDGLLLWMIFLGLAGMVFFRACMIAFVEVASFNIGTSVMYLATVHPLLLLYAAGTLLADEPERYEKTTKPEKPLPA